MSAFFKNWRRFRLFTTGELAGLHERKKALRREQLNRERESEARIRRGIVRRLKEEGL